MPRQRRVRARVHRVDADAGARLGPRGAKYRLLVTGNGFDRPPLRGTDGFCSHTRRTIWLRDGQRAFDFTDTLIHEMLHAKLPKVSERDVKNLANTIVVVLNWYGLLKFPERAPVKIRGVSTE